MTAFDQLERQLMASVSRRATALAADPSTKRRRPMRRWRLTAAMATLAAASLLGVVALLGGSSHSPSVAARMYAATDPTGALVHYVQVRKYSGAASAPTTTTQIWESGQRLRAVETTGRGVEAELVTTKNQVRTFIAASDIVSVVPAAQTDCLTVATPGCSLLSQVRATAPAPAARLALGGTAYADLDPVAELRQLFVEGRLHGAGDAVLAGRRVDRLLAASHGVVTQVFVAPRTFLPLAILQSARPGEDSTGGVSTSIQAYQRSPYNEAAASFLAMKPRPGARCVLATPQSAAGGGEIEEGHAGSGEPCAHLRTNTAFHPPGCGGKRCVVTGVPAHRHVVAP